MEPSAREEPERCSVAPRLHIASRHSLLQLLHEWLKVTVDLGGEWDFKFHTTIK